MKRGRWLVAAALIAALALPAPAQPSPAPGGETQLTDKLLSFIQSSAEILGQGLVNLINLVLPRGHEVTEELVVPLGYLGLLTLILLLFGILDAARKVIWILVGVGWVLMVVRIVIDAFAR
jgi:hypothetical protein